MMKLSVNKYNSQPNFKKVRTMVQEQPQEDYFLNFKREPSEPENEEETKSPMFLQLVSRGINKHFEDYKTKYEEGKFKTGLNQVDVIKKNLMLRLKDSLKSTAKNYKINFNLLKIKKIESMKINFLKSRREEKPMEEKVLLSLQADEVLTF